MAGNLKGKTFSSIIWTTTQKVLVLFIQFVSGIILARLLTPDDYGCIGMLVIFTSISSVFIDGGFGSALIQKKNTTQEDYSTVFYWNLVVSVFLYMILFVSAPYIASFYRMSTLSPVLRVQSLILIISALSAVQVNILKKEMKFREIALVTFLTSVIALAVTIVMAYMGFGVWALVVQFLLTALIPMFAYWIICRWIPKLLFSIRSFKELFSFGVFVLFTNFINNLGRSLEGLLIGHFYNSSTMGLYIKGKSLEGMAMTGVSDALNQVTFPLYSKYQDNKDELNVLIRQLTLSTAVIMFPFAFVLIIIAKPLFIILYSEKWLGSVPYFQILCLSGIAVALQGVNGIAITAIGLSRKMMNYTIIKRIINILLLLIGLFAFGMKGLLVAVVIESWLSYIINGYLVSKHIGYNMRQQIIDMLPIFLLSIIIFATLYIIQCSLTINIYVSSAITSIMYVITYLLLGLLLRFESFEYLKRIINIAIKYKKRNR